MGKEMTESVRDVLAEMRAALSEDTRCNRNTCECCLGHSILMGKFDVYIPRIEAARASAESPERKAFVEACEAHFMAATQPGKYVPNAFNAGYEKAADAYRAMIEKERNDA